MKKFNLFFIVALSIFFFSLVEPQEIYSFNLSQGKNIFNASFFTPIYASELISQYPEINAVSMTRGNETVGYVNFLGGIGQDFMLVPDSAYEIVSKQNLTIYLK